MAKMLRKSMLASCVLLAFSGQSHGEGANNGPTVGGLDGCDDLFSGHRSTSKRFELFRNTTPIVDFNVVIPDIQPGDEVVFASHEAFTIGSTRIKGPEVTFFELSNGKLLHLLSFSELEVGTYTPERYSYYAQKNERMSEGMPILAQNRIPLLDVLEFGSLGQFVVTENYPKDAVSLRSFFDRTVRGEKLDDPDYVEARSRLIGFAALAANFESFGDISLLDELLYTSERGWFLRRWGVPKLFAPVGAATRAMSVFDHDLSARVAFWPDDAYDKYRDAHFNESMPKVQQNFAAYILLQDLRNETREGREKSHPDKTIYVEDQRDVSRALLRRFDQRSAEEFYSNYQESSPGELVAKAEEKFAVSSDGRFLIFSTPLGHYRNSDLYFLNDMSNIRVFSEPVERTQPYTRRNVVYSMSVSDYVNQGKTLESLGVPVLDYAVPQHEKYIVEMRSAHNIMTLEDYLVRLRSGQIHDLDIAKMNRDLNSFAKKAAFIEELVGFELHDLIYVPKEGWKLRNWDSTLIEFKPRMNSVDGQPLDLAKATELNGAPSLFLEANLAAVGIDNPALSFWPNVPEEMDDEIKELFARLRATIQKTRENTFATPCPVLNNVKPRPGSR